jgi:type IV pilus assembly protein PilQ
MEILVKKNEVDNTRNVLGNPYIIKKETKTTLIVRDGETIVISGLTKQRTDRSESGIPWLKNIYGLGWLFKSLGTGESMEEVLIFITPTILPPQVIAAAPPATDQPVEKAPSGKTPVK